MILKIGVSQAIPNRSEKCTDQDNKNSHTREPQNEEVPKAVTILASVWIGGNGKILVRESQFILRFSQKHCRYHKNHQGATHASSICNYDLWALGQAHNDKNWD